MHNFILIVRPSSTEPRSGRDRSASDLHAMGPRFESHISLFFFSIFKTSRNCFICNLLIMIMTGFRSFLFYLARTIFNVSLKDTIWRKKKHDEKANERAGIDMKQLGVCHRYSR